MDEETELEPLGVTCTSTDCENGFHCFLQHERLPAGQPRRGGPCRECGADLIEWDRVNTRSVADIDHTFDSLRNELIRHVFWHTPFNQREINHARRKGRILLNDAARDRIRTSVGKAHHAREGRQTPFQGNVLFHAQHAVAACCRKCISYWHAVPEGRPLVEAEIDYLAELVARYLDDRLPWLQAEPMKVAAIRRPAVGR